MTETTCIVARFSINLVLPDRSGHLVRTIAPRNPIKAYSIVTSSIARTKKNRIVLSNKPLKKAESIHSAYAATCHRRQNESQLT